MPIKIGDKTYKPHQISEVRIGNKLYYRSALPKREISYYGTATPLSKARVTNNQVASVADYVLCLGGMDSAGALSDVAAYDASLVKSNALDMGASRRSACSTNFSGYAVIGGGYGKQGSAGNSYLSTYDAYNNNLVLSSGSIGYLTNGLATASNNNYCIFAGGYGSGLQNKMTYLNTSFVNSTGTSLNQSRQLLIGTSINNNILIAGGINTSSTRYKTVDVYDKDLVHSAGTNLSETRYLSSAGFNDKYAFIFGGYNCSISDSNRTCSSKVDVYDKDLVHSTASDLTTARGYSGGFSHPLFAGCVAGGRETGGTDSVVDYYDNDLVKSTYYLEYPVTEVGSSIVGDYILTFGGANYPTSSSSSRMLRDIVQVSKIS